MRSRLHHVSVWMNKAEYQYLKVQAELARMGSNPFIRSLVASVQFHPCPPDQYTALLWELSAIGNNINQIAYWANAQKSIRESEIVDAAILARRAWELVKNWLLFFEVMMTHAVISLARRENLFLPHADEIS